MNHCNLPKFVVVLITCEAEWSIGRLGMVGLLGINKQNRNVNLNKVKQDVLNQLNNRVGTNYVFSLLIDPSLYPNF